jgi:hypothetical protein
LGPEGPKTFYNWQAPGCWVVQVHHHNSALDKA